MVISLSPSCEFVNFAAFVCCLDKFKEEISPGSSRCFCTANGDDYVCAGLHADLCFLDPEVN